jgi:hypothetical protein
LYWCNATLPVSYTTKLSKYSFRKQHIQKKLCTKILNPHHPEPVEGQLNRKQLNNKQIPHPEPVEGQTLNPSPYTLHPTPYTHEQQIFVYSIIKNYF